MYSVCISKNVHKHCLASRFGLTSLVIHLLLLLLCLSRKMVLWVNRPQWFLWSSPCRCQCARALRTLRAAGRRGVPALVSGPRASPSASPPSSWPGGDRSGTPWATVSARWAPRWEMLLKMAPCKRDHRLRWQHDPLAPIKTCRTCRWAAHTQHFWGRICAFMPQI